MNNVKKPATPGGIMNLRNVFRMALGAAAFLLAVVASTSAMAQFSDDFTTDKKLNPGWILSEPNSLSSYALSSSGLKLIASGSGSDLWPFTNYEASLLLQPISPTADYTVTAHLSGYHPANFFSGAGIVLTQQTSGFNSASEFVRLEYTDDNGPDSLHRTTNGGGGGLATFAAGNDLYLRLTKSASSYTIAYSTNGTTFTTAGTFTDTARYTYIGLISTRWAWDGLTSVNNVADFKSFEAVVPAATISSLQPNSSDAKSAAFTLTVQGSNFVSGDTVDWNGVPLATTYVSPSKLTAKVTAAEIASAGTAAVTVVDTAAESAASNAALFTIPVTSIVVAAQTIKTTSSGYSVTLTLQNSGNSAATDISLTSAYLATSATTTPLPIDIASLAPNASTTVTLSFPSIAGKAGDEEYVSIYGFHDGGGIALTAAETLP